MNSATDPNELPSDSSASLTDEQIAEVEAELKATTPKTLPLKRGASPLFVPVDLPAAASKPVVPEGSANADTVTADSVVQPDMPSGVEPETPVELEKTEAIVAPEPSPTLPTVEFLPPPEAVHNASVTLSLSCSMPEASIRYALDAEDVGEDGLLYNPAQRIFLTQSTTVAVRAFLSGQSGPLAVGRFEISKPSWQKLEPTEQIDPTTHEESDEATLEGAWHLAAASVRGRLHAHRGGWREDAFRHALAHASDGTYSIVVVSDGAGSATLSRVGSNLLCEVARDFLCSALTDSAPLSSESKALIEQDLPLLRGLLVESATRALQQLRDEADKRSRPLSDFAATLLILVRREWNGQQLCAALQAGDGGIALWDEDDTLTILGEADHGQHSSETRFLTTNGVENELASRVKFSIRPKLRAVAVMTDGVADDFFPETERFPELFKTVLPLVEGSGSPSSGAALLDWIDYEKKGSSDDRALVICWRSVVPVTENEVSSDGNL